MDTNGTATIEFVLVLMQNMLVMTGNLFVQHAVFTATRSAVAQNLVDYGSQIGLGANLFALVPGLSRMP